MSWLDPFLRLFRRKPRRRSRLSFDLGGVRSPHEVVAPDDLSVPPRPEASPPAAPVALEHAELLPPAGPVAFEPAPAVLEPSPVEPPPLALAPAAAYPASAPLIELEEEIEARDFEEEADAEIEPLDEDAEAGPSLDERILDALDEVPHRRAAARIAALAGAHRVALTDAAGPGSIAEALIDLEREGAVTCTVSEDEAGRPCLDYAPVGIAPDGPGAALEASQPRALDG